MLKKRFTEEPILTHYNLDKEVILETDVSDYAIGACISQKDLNGKLRPIAYFSKKLSLAKLNYDVYNKELLAIVRAIEH